MVRQRKPKAGQTTVSSEFVSVLHDDPIGLSWSTIRVDTHDWFLWLQTAKSFSVDLAKCSYVARNETRRKQPGFWYAYTWIESKTVKVYIGKTDSLTYERLQSVCEDFARKLS